MLILGIAGVVILIMGCAGYYRVRKTRTPE
jgi:hypothetical protein